MIKGLMIDAARLPESIESYKKLVDFAAEWNYNTILFRTADDQGCAIKFPGINDIIYHKDAYSESEIKDFVSYASKKKIDIIPEIESFGHSRYITDSPEYAELLDAAPENRDAFSGLCPVNPKTLKLVAKLYAATVKLFKSKYIHGGCDEVAWGGSELSKKALEKESRTQIWIKYLNALHKEAQKLKKEFIIWADHVVRHDSAILDGLNKEIVLIDWDYWTIAPSELVRQHKTAADKGFKIIGAPAAGWCKWNQRIGKSQLMNIDAMTDVYFHKKFPSSMGMILTNWCPWRFLPHSYYDAYAYAAVSMNQGTAESKAFAFQQFVEKHYRAEWNNDWAETFRKIYDIVPPKKGCAQGYEHPFIRFPWHDEKSFADALACKIPAPDFEGVESLLVRCEASVIRNLQDFEAFRLSVKCLKHIYWRDSIIKSKAASENSTFLIKTIAEKDAALHLSVKKLWDSVRPVASDGSLMKSESEKNENLIYFMKRAADFSAKLAAKPAAFKKLLIAQPPQK